MPKHEDDLFAEKEKMALQNHLPVQVMLFRH